MQGMKLLTCRMLLLLVAGVLAVGTAADAGAQIHPLVPNANVVLTGSVNISAQYTAIFTFNVADGFPRLTVSTPQEVNSHVGFLVSQPCGFTALGVPL